MRFLLASIIPLALVIYVLMMNPQSVHVKLTNHIAYDVPFVLVVVVLMTVGFLVSYLMNLGREVGFLVERRKWKKREETRSLVESLYSAAETLYGEGRKEDALELLKKALKEDSSFVLAGALMSRILREEGRLKEALQLNTKLKQAGGQNPVLGIEMSRTLLAMGDYSKALDELKPLLKDKKAPKAVVLRLLVEAHLGLHESSRAIAFQERLVKETPQNLREKEEKRLTGLLYQVALEEKDAAALLKLTKKYPKFVPAYMAYSQLVEPKKAVERLQKGLMDNPEALELAERLMELVAEENHPAEAIHFFQKFASANTKSPQSRIPLVMLYLRLGMFSEAVKAAGLIDAPIAMADLLRAKAREANGEDKIALEMYSKGCTEGLLQRFKCQECGAVLDQWNDRCDSCGTWGAVHLEYI